MALAAVPNDRFITPQETRERELFDQLYVLHPESKPLLSELSDLIGTLMNQAEDRGVERHGAQILQMIEGSRYQRIGCEPDSVETPGDWC
jgi:hypothetical protein